MATKTWKIGEYCKGGIITVITSDKEVVVIGKEWDFSTGSRRSSDQTNAKEWTRFSIAPTKETVHRELSEFLNDLTTSYYADQVIKWIESKVKLYKSLWW